MILVEFMDSRKPQKFRSVRTKLHARLCYTGPKFGIQRTDRFVDRTEPNEPFLTSSLRIL